MTDESRHEPPGRDPLERDPTLNEILDLAMRRIAFAIVVAGGAIALALYARPSPPRYEAFATDAGIVRIDKKSGRMIACEGGRCMTVLERHQKLAPNPNVIRKKEPAALPKQ